MIYIGSDHRGFDLKGKLLQKLQRDGYQTEDLGNVSLDPEDDYVDYAEKVAKSVAQDPENRGIVLCGSGVGVDIVANKIDGIRCALVDNQEIARLAREHEDANVIAMPSDTLDEDDAYQMVKIFLDTPFSSEKRHERRIEKIEDIEKEN